MPHQGHVSRHRRHVPSDQRRTGRDFTSRPPQSRAPATSRRASRVGADRGHRRHRVQRLTCRRAPSLKDCRVTSEGHGNRRHQANPAGGPAPRSWPTAARTHRATAPTSLRAASISPISPRRPRQRADSPRNSRRPRTPQSQEPDAPHRPQRRRRSQRTAERHRHSATPALDSGVFTGDTDSKPQTHT